MSSDGIGWRDGVIENEVGTGRRGAGDVTRNHNHNCWDCEVLTGVLTFLVLVCRGATLSYPSCTAADVRLSIAPLADYLCSPNTHLITCLHYLPPNIYSSRELLSESYQRLPTTDWAVCLAYYWYASPTTHCDVQFSLNKKWLKYFTSRIQIGSNSNEQAEKKDVTWFIFWTYRIKLFFVTNKSKQSSNNIVNTLWYRI